MQNLKFRFRLYPTPAQERKLVEIAGANRWIWNYMLASEKDYYDQTKKFKFYNTNSAELPKLKQTYLWLKQIPSTSLQQTLRYLDRALRDSFKSKKSCQRGFPKFKKKRNFSASFTLTMVNSKTNCRDHAFYIPKVGDVKCVYHRALPSDFASCQIVRDGNRWFVVLTVKKSKTQLPTTGKTVGIDLNSKEYVTSDGQRITIPKPLHENQVQMKKLQRELARKEPGSANYKKTQLKLYKLHQYIRNFRHDFFHKLSHEFVVNYDVISLEDLDVRGMQQWNGHVVKDNGFGMFRDMITYKADLYGRSVKIVNRYYPSSQICSQCGAYCKKSLAERIHSCKVCGCVMDRDLNAAININRAGTAPSACGADSLCDAMTLIGCIVNGNEAGSCAL